MLASECPNCGRQHSGHSFIGTPGPIQRHLLILAKAAHALVDQYEEDRSDSYSDAVNAALTTLEEAGYLRFETVITLGIAK